MNCKIILSVVLFTLFFFMMGFTQPRELKLDTVPLKFNPDFDIRKSSNPANPDTLVVPYFKTTGSLLLPHGLLNVISGKNGSWEIIDSNGAFFSFLPGSYNHNKPVVDTTLNTLKITTENNTKDFIYGKLKLKFINALLSENPKEYVLKQKFGYIEVLDENKKKLNAGSILNLSFKKQKQITFFIRTNLETKSTITTPEGYIEQNVQIKKITRVPRSNTTEYTIEVQKSNYSGFDKTFFLVVSDEGGRGTPQKIKIVQSHMHWKITDPANEVVFSNAKDAQRHFSVETDDTLNFTTNTPWLKLLNSEVKLSGIIDGIALSENSSSRQQVRFANLIVNSSDNEFSDTIRNYFKQVPVPFYFHALPQTIVLNQNKGSSDTVYVNSNLEKWRIIADSSLDASWLMEPQIKFYIDSSNGSIVFKSIEDNIGGTALRHAKFKLYGNYLEVTPVYLNIFQSNAVNIVLNNLAINSLWVKLDPVTNGLTINIFDQNGNPVFNSPLIEKDNLFNISHLSSGFYLVYIYNSSGNVLAIEKFIKP